LQVRFDANGMEHRVKRDIETGYYIVNKQSMDCCFSVYFLFQTCFIQSIIEVIDKINSSNTIAL